MRTHRGVSKDYGWLDVQSDLAAGVHPAVVAARLGEHEDYIREVADRQGWPVSHKPHAMPSADEMLDRYAAMHGLDS